MPVKLRPPSLSAPPPAASGGLTVTDTMTLVIQDGCGRELRVKDSLQAPPSASSTPTPHESLSGGDESKSVLDRINFDQLRIGVVVGQGSGGKVRAAQHRQTKKAYALKYVDFDGKAEEAQTMIANELRRVEALKHENIVSSYEAFFRKGRLCVVLEWMDAGSMADIITRREKEGFPDCMIAYVAKGLLKGLVHLHHERVIHRDIKPANVLANSMGDVKISDFGIARVFSGTATSTVVAAGSTPYMSPEMISSETYSFETDVWSAGMTIAECAIGAYPFQKKHKVDPYEMFETVQKGKDSIVWDQKGRHPSAILKSFVEACLEKKEKRPSAKELLDHPFIKLADEVSKEQAGRWFMEGKKTSTSSEQGGKDHE